ncbi:MAG: hypothetical protein CMK70_03865 [Pseudohongiella sp.]|nr:hypothetical protein [Pseudohongiella sp.]|tara:strand:+ start:4213 stop:4794 length:582 start_codon:yes stop_codon:yes gene_type:complete
MSDWLYLLLIPLVRFLININGWFYLRTVLEKHRVYLYGAIQSNPSPADKNSSDNAARWITANMTEIKSKVSKAGLQPSVKSFMEPIGYGHVQQQQLNVLDNLLFLNKEIVAEACRCIEMAKGHYYVQAMSSLSPVYWAEIIFYLPRYLISASGIDTTSKVVDVFSKVSQIFYWLVIVVIILFKPELLYILDSR